MNSLQASTFPDFVARHAVNQLQTQYKAGRRASEVEIRDFSQRKRWASAPKVVTRRESKKNRESQAIKRYAIVQACKRAGWFLVEQYKSGSRYQIIQWLTLQTNFNTKTKSKPNRNNRNNRLHVIGGALWDKKHPALTHTKRGKPLARYSALRSKISSSARLTESGSVHFHCAHLATSGCCGACALVKSTLCW